MLIVGGGQAGLAMGHALAESGLRYEILEANSAVGDSWRRRFDSLTLFTPRAYSALPGMALAGDPQGLPRKDEIAGYLADYARRFALPIRLESRVTRLERVGTAFAYNWPTEPTWWPGPLWSRRARSSFRGCRHSPVGSRRMSSS